MSEPAIEACRLSKGYRSGDNQLVVLDALDLEVRCGEMVAVVGVSGVGKSTLLHLLGGVDRPDAGRVKHAGQDLAQLDTEALAAFRNRQVGFLFQFHYLLPEFSALENVMMPRLIAGEVPHSVEPAAQALLEEMGLGSRTHHRPAELSGGEQQRVALARALIQGPPVLLCDEPTGNLDAQTGGQVFSLLKQRARAYGATTVVVTHNLELARGADRVLRLTEGRLVRQ